MMHKKRKKLLLGMAVLFAACTAGVSCNVWATEQTYGIRRFLIIKDGEETFEIAQEPADYKMEFDYWEILNPYDETATVNTENMYEMFDILARLDFDKAVIDANVDTGLNDTQTYLKVDYAENTDDEAASVTILLGSTDENGDYYAAIEGVEDIVYQLPGDSVERLLQIQPFDLILKIPVLVNINTLDKVEMTIQKKNYSMQIDGQDYRFGKKTVKREIFTELYQALQSVTLQKEWDPGSTDMKTEELLSVTFHRNTEDAPEITLSYQSYDDTYASLKVNGIERFLVYAEDVEALIKQIKKAF